MVHDDRSLNNRFHQLIENGTIDRAYNEQVTCAFMNIPFTEYVEGVCEQAKKRIYVNSMLRWCPWFILDKILVHEAAHISKGYKYGFDTDSDDSHGPEFEEFNHIFMASLRELLAIPCYLIGYLFAAIAGGYKISGKSAWNLLSRLTFESVLAILGGAACFSFSVVLARSFFDNGLLILGTITAAFSLLFLLAIVAAFIDTTSD